MLIKKETMIGLEERFAISDKVTESIDKVTHASDPTNHADITAIIISLICIVALIVITFVVTILAYRSLATRSLFKRKKTPPKWSLFGRKDHRLPKSHDVNIPEPMKGQSYPVAFTIPTAPQMPHEMPRSYIHHPKTSIEATGDKRKKSFIRPGKLGVIGKSKSEQTAHVKREAFALSRSQSVPSRLNIDLPSKSPVTSQIGTIDPKLYSPQKDEDLQEFRPSKYGLGKISFSLMYADATELLAVHLIQAAQLPVLTKHQKTPDTSIKILLLSDDDNISRPAHSRVFKRSLNPRFNQTFVFYLPKFAITEASVRFVAFQYDRFSHAHVVGRADYPCVNHDFDALGADHTIWRDITEHPWENEVTLIGY